MDMAFEKDDAKFWLEQLGDQITIPEIQETKKKKKGGGLYISLGLIKLKCSMQDGSSEERPGEKI